MRWLFSACVVILGLASGSIQATDCEPWFQVGTMPPGFQVRSIEFANGMWVAVGDGGQVSASPNGATWSLVDSSTQADLRDVAWGGAEFIAVGEGVILSSPDGTTWSAVTSEPQYDLFGVAWMDLSWTDSWVAVGSNGLVLRSSDAREWELRSTAATGDLRDVTASFIGFVAVGRDGQVLTSRDGWGWTLQSPVPAGFPNSLYAVTAGPDRVVAVGGDTFSLVVSSADGAGWTVELEGAGGRDWLNDVAWGEPGFATAGAIFADLIYPSTGFSADGRRWTSGSTGLDGEGDAREIAWGQGRWLVVLSNGEVFSRGTCFSRWLQIVASTPGQFGSQWQTDVTVRNSGSAPVDVELIFDPAGSAQSLNQSIAPGAQAVWEDLVGSGFGVEGKAPLVVRSDGRVSVSARVANVDHDGTFGQWMPGIDRSDAIPPGKSVELLHLRQDEGAYRTNLGYLNLSGHQSKIAVDLFATDGTRLSRHEVALEAGQLIQELEPFVTIAGAPRVGWGFAVISAIQGEGVVVMASVIDSRTNDATTVLPEPLASYVPVIDP